MLSTENDKWGADCLDQSRRITSEEPNQAGSDTRTANSTYPSYTSDQVRLCLRPETRTQRYRTRT